LLNIIILNPALSRSLSQVTKASNAKRRERRRKKISLWLAEKKTSYSNGEGGISFDDKSRTVKWYVTENNHACESAHESFMGNAFFRALGQVVWTRGTGGEIVGNDEYNRESKASGDGGNFTKQTFGPKYI